MDLAIERQTLVEIAVSVLGVGVFIVGMMAVGVTYAENGLGEEGVIAMIGVIVLFILVMSGVGYWLSTRES